MVTFIWQQVAGVDVVVRFIVVLILSGLVLLGLYAWDPLTWRAYQPASMQISHLATIADDNWPMNRPIVVQGRLLEHQGHFVIRSDDGDHEVQIVHAMRDGIDNCIDGLREHDVVVMGFLRRGPIIDRVFSIRPVRRPLDGYLQCVHHPDYDRWLATDKV
jgi:hypothetical protein